MHPFFSGHNSADASRPYPRDALPACGSPSLSRNGGIFDYGDLNFDKTVWIILDRLEETCDAVKL